MELVGRTFYFAWEVGLMSWLQAALSSPVINIISFLSFFGEEMLFILIIGAFYWGIDKQMGKRLGLYVLAGETWNSMIKNISCRRRPYMDHDSIEIKRVVTPGADPMDIAAQGYSFPSGHSTGAVTMYGGLARELKKKWMTVIAVVLPLLVGFSRVVVGAHYPTDVLIGWLLGLATVLVVSFLFSRIRNELVIYGILLAVSIPGVFYCHSEDYFTSLGMMIGLMAGSLLDTHVGKFENTRSVVFIVLRVIGGLLIYLGLNSLLKLPFSKAFLSGGTTAAMLVRTGRYAVIVFLLFGVYPMLFAPVERKLSALKKS